MRILTIRHKNRDAWVGPLMANAILNFHFDFLTPSLMDKQDLDLISVLKILRDLLPGSSWQLPVGHVLLNLLELEIKHSDQDQ